MYVFVRFIMTPHILRSPQNGSFSNKEVWKTDDAKIIKIHSSHILSDFQEILRTTYPIDISRMLNMQKQPTKVFYQKECS